MNSRNEFSISLGRKLRLVLIALLGEIGFDFFLHAGILKNWYESPVPFLLPQQDAFRLIPLGYASFFLLTVLLMWMMLKTGITGGKKGFIFGLQLGGLMWLSFTLGLGSIATAPAGMLAGWFVGQSFELALAGWIMGTGLEQGKLGNLFLKVFGFLILCLVLGIILQNIL